MTRWIIALACVVFAAIGLICLEKGIRIDLQWINGPGGAHWFYWRDRVALGDTFIRFRCRTSSREEFSWCFDWGQLVGIFLCVAGLCLLKPMQRALFARSIKKTPVTSRSRIRRYILPLLTLFSLTVFLTLAAIRIGFNNERQTLFTAGYSSGIDVGINYGMLCIELGAWATDDSLYAKLIPNQTLHLSTGPGVRTFEPGAGSWRSFSWDATCISRNDNAKRVSLTMPTWPLLFASALLPCWFLLTLEQKKRLRRIANHCCQECGYDLRASPRRCPECGWVPGTLVGSPGPSRAGGW